MANVNTPYPYTNALEDPSCSLCLETFSTPVRLACGHIFDFECIKSWLNKSQNCPFDRSVVKLEQVEYCDGLVEKIKELEKRKKEATFHFKFLSGNRIDPISIDIEDPVQNLKLLVCKSLNLKNKENQYNLQPRQILLILNLPAANQRLYSNKKLSEFDLTAEKSYQIAVRLKLAQFGQPCDYCFNNFEKEKTCHHTDSSYE